MRTLPLLLVLVALTACAVTQPRVADVQISRIGIVNALPGTGQHIHKGLTVFDNRYDDLAVSWDFPALVFAELKQRLSGRGIAVVDLTDDLVVSPNADSLFEVGYSFRFGLSAHILSGPTRARLAALMKTHNLDAIAVLRAAEHNEASPTKWPKYNTSAFGLYGYWGGVFRDDLQHSFVQIEARVIAGDPPGVIQDLHSSSLIKRLRGKSGWSPSGPELDRRFQDQTRTAVSEIALGLGS